MSQKLLQFKNTYLSLCSVNANNSSHHGNLVYDCIIKALNDAFKRH